MKVCPGCGQVQEIRAYDEALWDIYSRIKDGRSMAEPLVYDSQWLQENVMDEEDEAAVMHSMEKDMRSRGLCIVCARPDLRGVSEDDILSEEDSKEIHEMWAEQAAERRAGC
jgi:hypothetical protein